MDDYIGIKIAGGRIKRVLNASDRRAKAVHCYTVKNNQETLKIEFYFTVSGKKPEIIGNLALKDLKFLSKGDIAADLILKNKDNRLHVFVNYKPDGVEQHFAVDFEINTLKGKTVNKDIYLEYGTFITSSGNSDSRTLEEQIEQDIEEDIFVEEELDSGSNSDKSIVVEEKKRFSLVKFILFFFYGILAAGLILLLIALTFEEVSINELLKMIGLNFNLKF